MTRLLIAVLLCVTLSGAALAATEVPGGVVHDDPSAKDNCPLVCNSSGAGQWNGAWRMKSDNTSVCSCGAAERRRSAWPGLSYSPVPAARGGDSSCSVPPSQTGSCPACSVSCSGDKHASCQQGQEWPGGSPTCMRDAKCECQ
ncbi:MAG: hypothetical protein ABSD80_03120 [Caulobacteraceae bacterium]